MQILYRMELNPCGAEEAIDEATSGGKCDLRTIAFARQLVLGASARRNEIDKAIAGASLKWDIGRMAVVDRNILRLAVHELMDDPDMPSRVVLNEAIELAKSFGGEESANFVNGVLDRIRSDLGRET